MSFKRMLLSSLLVLGAASASAGQLYRWESPDGTVSFTDDPRRIPDRYREKAAVLDTGALAEYGRYTPTDPAATGEYERRLNERLDGLRAANEIGADAARVDAERERVTPGVPPTRLTAPTRRIERRRAVVQPDGSIRYRYSSNEVPTFSATPSLPVDPDDPTPVVTEQKRVKIPGQPITQTVIVTRQGDRVLSVTAPQSNYHTLDFGDLDELER